jgi:hypothetical protein
MGLEESTILRRHIAYLLCGTNKQSWRQMSRRAGHPAVSYCTKHTSTKVPYCSKICYHATFEDLYYVVLVSLPPHKLVRSEYYYYQQQQITNYEFGFASNGKTLISNSAQHLSRWNMRTQSALLAFILCTSCKELIIICNTSVPASKKIPHQCYKDWSFNDAQRKVCVCSENQRKPINEPCGRQGE